MDGSSLWFYFLLFFVVFPYLKQQSLRWRRFTALRNCEKRRRSRIITLIHRQEIMGFWGMFSRNYINIEDSEEVLRAIRLTSDDTPIDLIVHTPGGLLLAAEQIARALKNHPAKVTVIVPHYAMSGGTMIALSADEVVMDDNAVLGPVDPQIGQFPAVSILKVVEEKNIDKVDDQTLIWADMSRKAINQVKNTIRRIANERYGAELADKLAEELASGQWTHDYPISSDEARSLGLLVSSEMPTEIYKLMNLYPQAATRRPSVDFIPLPYPARPALPKSSEPKA